MFLCTPYSFNATGQLLKSFLLCNKDCHFDETGNDVNTKGEFNRYFSLSLCDSCVRVVTA